MAFEAKNCTGMSFEELNNTVMLYQSTITFEKANAEVLAVCEEVFSNFERNPQNNKTLMSNMWRQEVHLPANSFIASGWVCSGHSGSAPKAMFPKIVFPGYSPAAFYSAVAHHCSPFTIWTQKRPFAMLHNSSVPTYNRRAGMLLVVQAQWLYFTEFGHGCTLVYSRNFSQSLS